MKTIGVLTPSGAVDEKALAGGIAYWKNKGYQVKESTHLYAKNRFLAGSDEERAADLTALFCDDDVDVIMAACGGYGSARMLGRLDYRLISAHKKPFVGLSDTTALQLALLEKSGLVSFSGYLMKPRHGREMFPYTEQSLFDCLSGQEQVFSGLETDYDGGEIAGRLIGGCLSLVVGLSGTPYFPDMSGSILVLEDLNEEPYVIDRMLTQLENAGVFEKAAAVVFGAFIGCKAKDPADGTIEDVLNEWKRRIKCPVFAGFPYGHQAGSAVWPVGGQAVLNAGTMRVSGVEFNG